MCLNTYFVYHMKYLCPLRLVHLNWLHGPLNIALCINVMRYYYVLIFNSTSSNSLRLRVIVLGCYTTALLFTKSAKIRSSRPQQPRPASQFNPPWRRSRKNLVDRFNNRRCGLRWNTWSSNWKVLLIDVGVKVECEIRG